MVAVASASAVEGCRRGGRRRGRGGQSVGQVWSLTQFYSVDFSQSRVSVRKVRFQQTHNQGLRQLLLTVSWDLCA